MFYPPLSAGSLVQGPSSTQTFQSIGQPQSALQAVPMPLSAQQAQFSPQSIATMQQEIQQLRAQVAQTQMQAPQGVPMTSVGAQAATAPTQQTTAKSSLELTSKVTPEEKNSLLADLNRFSLNVGNLEQGTAYSIQEVMSFTAYASSSSRDLDSYQWASLMEGTPHPLAASMVMVVLASTSSVVQRFVRLGSTKGVQEDLKRVLPLVQTLQKDFARVKDMAGTDNRSLRNSSVSASCGTAANLLALGVLNCASPGMRACVPCRDISEHVQQARRRNRVVGGCACTQDCKQGHNSGISEQEWGIRSQEICSHRSDD